MYTSKIFRINNNLHNYLQYALYSYFKKKLLGKK